MRGQGRHTVAPLGRRDRRHRGKIRRPEQGRPHHARGIVGIVVVANVTAAPTKDHSVRPSGALISDPTTNAPTTPANLRCGE